MKHKVLTTVAAASIAISTPLIADLEGMQGKPYKDIGGVWTYCYGETENVDFSKVYTKQECDDLLQKRVPDYYFGAMKYVEKDIPITMRAAVTSFNYNVGEGNFKNSTMLKKINQGNYYEACQELDRWVYVGKMFVKGLSNRRKREKQLCIAEIPYHG